MTQCFLGGVPSGVRLIALGPLMVLVAACSSTRVLQPGSAPTAGRHGPPPAWIETKAGSRWLGFSSYCWPNPNQRSGVCADAVAPECNGKGIPNIDVQSGETVRVHLGYKPEEASIEGADVKLDGRVASWRVNHGGPFGLFTRAAGKDASYVGCAVFR